MSAAKQKHLAMEGCGPLLDYYRDLRALCCVGRGRRADFTLADLLRSAQMAARFTPTQRAAVIADIAAFSLGTVPCPSCAWRGPHTSNGHHRFGKLAFKCRECNATFKATEVET